MSEKQQQAAQKKAIQAQKKQQVSSMKEFVVNGEQELQALANTGNTVAQEWLAKVQATNEPFQKLVIFGEMRIALMQDSRPEARAVEREMFPE